ncbi:sensor histidine kinase [Kitasatospora sp. NPDC096204]|uniref:sensor histidine kinase n=1 Tax=Kitasatospora sp. NPDC096204 TaxID=3364094 RepID=UPI0038289494
MATAISHPHRTRTERQLTAAAVVTAVCFIVATLWICYVLVHVGDPGVSVPREALLNLLAILPAAAAGMLLHAHRPGSPLGWVFLVWALSFILTLAPTAPAWVEVTTPGLIGAILVVEVIGLSVSSTIIYALPLWLPDGRLTTRRWWWYIAAVSLYTVPDAAALLDRPHSFGRPNPLAGTPPARFFSTMAGTWTDHDRLINDCLLGFVAIVLLTRMLRRRSRGNDAEVTRRRRFRVLAMLGTYSLFAATVALYSRLSSEHFWLTYVLYAVAGLVWAVVSFLVVRHHGWRLDRAARNVLIGLLLGTGVTGLFVVAAAVLSDWLVPGHGAAALVLIALVYALGAALPRAARGAVALVDRLYFGERAQPYQVLRTLAGRLRQVVDPEHIPETLCSTVAEELRLPGVALSVITQSGYRTLATTGRLGGLSQDFLLFHNGMKIGTLTVGLRSGEQRLDASDVDILRSLADQASPAVASLRLQEDLRASREQVVSAREEERRWLRRDIHDGLGPALAGLRLQVDNAGSEADGRLADTLHRVSDGLGLALKDVRRITDRLGPAPVCEFGLTRAVRRLAETFTGTGLTVTVELSSDPLPDLPAAVENAAYRITAEALNNVVRHARARTARVTLRVDAEELTLIVHDDGVGYQAEQRLRTGGGGVGMRSMAERAAEVGGRCTVRSLPEDGGTQVVAVLPCSPMARNR